MSQPSAFKKLTGLWPSEKGHLSGKSNEETVIPAGAKLFVFKNKQVTGKQPTHNLSILDESAENEQGGGNEPF